MAANDNTRPEAAPNPVQCPPSPNGIHSPRTVEGVEVINGIKVHTKTSLCRHCNNVA